MIIDGREFPRWVHRRGNGDKDSVIVETPEQEAAQLATWNRADSHDQVAAMSEPEGNALMDEPRKPRGWPKGKPRTAKSAEALN